MTLHKASWRQMLIVLAAASGTLKIANYVLKNVQVNEIVFPVMGILAVVVFATLIGRVVAAARRLQRTPRVYISYHSRDEQLARMVRNLLNARGVRTWLDRDQLRPGDNWRLAVERAISDADTVLLLAPASRDEQVNSEMRAATRHHVRVVPVITRDDVVEDSIQALAPVDVRGINVIDAAQIVADVATAGSRRQN